MTKTAVATPDPDECPTCGHSRGPVNISINVYGEANTGTLGAIEEFGADLMRQLPHLPQQGVA